MVLVAWVFRMELRLKLCAVRGRSHRASTSARVGRSGCSPAEPYPPARLVEFMLKQLCSDKRTDAFAAVIEFDLGVQVFDLHVLSDESRACQDEESTVADLAGLGDFSQQGVGFVFRFGELCWSASGAGPEP